MKKTHIILLVLALILIIGYMALNSSSSPESQESQNNQVLSSDYKNATYIIDGRAIKLVDGVSETEAAPGSAAKFTTRYFGNEIRHDLNDDGREDVVFLVSQETGGSAVFFYVVAALNTPTGNVGSHAFFLGDRIAPQTTEIDEEKTTTGSNRKNVIVVDYADRLPDEPFTAEPSVGKSVWIKLDPTTMQFGEVEKNFEGESK